MRSLSFMKYEELLGLVRSIVVGGRQGTSMEWGHAFSKLLGGGGGGVALDSGWMLVVSEP